MSQGPERVSFFPSSSAIINGGTFTGIINNSHTHIQSVGKGGYERLLDVVATKALHNSGHVFDPPRCHPGTRVAMMDTIMEWKSGRPKNVDIRQKNVAWLSGGAGAGKSAIGRSICERCEEEGTLLASFFFGSTDPTRNHAKSLAATIAYQICVHRPQIRKAVSDFVDADPLIFSRSLRTQFEFLVVDPLATVYANNPQDAPGLIVIDGLDECLDKASQRDVIETVTYIVSICSIPIRVLICSRPDSHITNTFSSAKINRSVFTISLSTEYTSSRDIKLYLDDRFRDIREGHIFKSMLPPRWPHEDHVNQLVKNSSGQFIYASTVVRYVESPQHRPNQRLDAILGLRRPFKDLPFADLDAVYTHVLSMSEDPRLAVSILAFPALYNQIACSDIERLLGLESGDVQVALSDLASLVNLSVTESGVLEVFLLHKSFADFLFDSSRSNDFHVSIHETVALNVLHVMRLFSEKHSGCRFEEHVHLSPVWKIFSHQSIDHQLWKISDQEDFLDSLAKFPVEAFTQDLFTHKKLYCAESTFLPYLFEFLGSTSQPQEIRDMGDRHIQLFCKTVLTALRDKFSDDREMNFIFAFTQIIPVDFHANLMFRPNCIAGTLFALAYKEVKNLRIDDTFRHLMDDAERTRICSLAATYCLEFLCERFRLLKVYDKPRRGLWVDKARRKTIPWQWHRRHPYLHLRATMIRVTNTHECYRDHFPAYEAFKGFNICPISHSSYVGAPTAVFTDRGVKYVTVMRSFIDILPLAGRYAPLIQLCKTRSFSPLSIWTPFLSRQARRLIARYLERMELMAS